MGMDTQTTILGKNILNYKYIAKSGPGIPAEPR